MLLKCHVRGGNTRGGSSGEEIHVHPKHLHSGVYNFHPSQTRRSTFFTHHGHVLQLILNSNVLQAILNVGITINTRRIFNKLMGVNAQEIFLY